MYNLAVVLSSASMMISSFCEALRLRAINQQIHPYFEALTAPDSADLYSGE